MKARNSSDGLWIGRGFADQQVFRISTITKEMSLNYSNNYGYLNSDSMPDLVKLIDFVDVLAEDDDYEE
jgi:hypothetical protein